MKGGVWTRRKKFEEAQEKEPLTAGARGRLPNGEYQEHVDLTASGGGSTGGNVGGHCVGVME